MVLEGRCHAIGLNDHDRVFSRHGNSITTYALTCHSFLIFPSSFSDSLNLTIDQNTAGIAAIILLALGYTLSVALWFICTSWLFQLDVIFL